jgi:hypothetical protein
MTLPKELAVTRRNARQKLGLIALTATLVGGVAGLSIETAAYASGPANGTQVPGSDVPSGSYTAGTPFSSGQNIKVLIPTNSNLTPGAKVNIIECADPSGSATNLPTSVSQCDGNTIQGSTVFVASNGSVTFSPYTVYALPDAISLGEPRNTTPVCNLSNECVLFIGQDENNFAGSPHYFSEPFFVTPNSTDNGADPGDGSPGKTPQTITFTTTPPSPAVVGGTYTPHATGGGSGIAVVFSIDASSTSGACSLNGAVVSFTGNGTCKVDANQAGNTTYAAATPVTQSFTIGPVGPGFTSANHTTATEGSSFSFPVTTTGSPSPKIKGKGKLPKGVKFHKGVGTATLSGIPTATKHKSPVGTFHLTITATFGKGKTKQVVTQAFTLQVNA